MKADVHMIHAFCVRSGCSINKSRPCHCLLNNEKTESLAQNTFKIYVTKCAQIGHYSIKIHEHLNFHITLAGH
jgi:hypothetical protein